MDGLIAAAGIQQETPALEYTAKDANLMFNVNITGVFMTAQAVAKQMIKFGNGGSIAMIASMSASVANRVRIALLILPPKRGFRVACSCLSGLDMSRLQRLQSRSRPTSAKSSFRMGPIRYPGQYDLTGLYCHRHGGGAFQAIP